MLSKIHRRFCPLGINLLSNSDKHVQFSLKQPIGYSEYCTIYDRTGWGKRFLVVKFPINGLSYKTEKNFMDVTIIYTTW